MQQRYEHFIGGSFTAPTGGRYFDSIDPARNEKAAEIARGDARDVDAAVRAAKVAFAEGSDARPIVRGRILFEIARRLRAEVDALARLETLENGKPIGQSRADVETAAQLSLVKTSNPNILMMELAENRQRDNVSNSV